MGAGSSGHAEAEEQEEWEEQGQVFVMVGTGEERGQQAGGMWNPCKGRLLMMRVHSSQNGTSRLLEREEGFSVAVLLASRWRIHHFVHSLCVFCSCCC